MDLLAQNRAAFQVFNGILSVLEGLVLHQSVALRLRKGRGKYLDESGTTIHVHVEILDRSIFRAHVEQVFFLCFFVDVC